MNSFYLIIPSVSKILSMHFICQKMPSISFRKTCIAMVYWKNNIGDFQIKIFSHMRHLTDREDRILIWKITLYEKTYFSVFPSSKMTVSLLISYYQDVVSVKQFSKIQKHKKSQNHRNIGVDKDLQRSPSPTPFLEQVPYTKLCRKVSKRVLNICRKGDALHLWAACSSALSPSK